MSTNQQMASAKGDGAMEAHVTALVRKLLDDNDKMGVIRALDDLMSLTKRFNTVILKTIIQAGGVRNIIRAMKTFNDCHPIANCGLFMITLLTSELVPFKNEQNMQEVIAAGGIPLIINTMENLLDENHQLCICSKHDDSQKVIPVQSLTLAMTFLTKCSRSHTSLLIDSGGINIAVKAMKSHPGEVELQKVALSFLNDLIIVMNTISGHSVENNVSKTMIEAGGIEAMIEAMMRHTSSATTQLLACTMMSVALRNDATRDHISNAIAKAGGVAPLAEAANIFLHEVSSDLPKVSLLKLSGTNLYAKILKKKRGALEESLRDIASAINGKNTDCTEIPLAVVASVLQDVACGSVENAVSVQKTGVLPVLLKSLKSYTSLGLQYSVLRMSNALMEKLKDTPFFLTAANEMLDIGVLEAIVVAIERNIGNIGQLISTELGCELLAILSSDKVGKPEIVVAAGGVQVLEAAKSRYKTNSDIQRFSNMSLDRLNTIPHCYNCNTIEASCELQKLMTCSRCKVAKYCSQNCQKKNWKIHRLQCKNAL